MSAPISPPSVAAPASTEHRPDPWLPGSLPAAEKAELTLASTPLEPALSEADCIVVACKSVGLKPYAQKASGGADVTYLLNDAWKAFRAKPNGFSAWELAAVAQLKFAFNLP